MTRINRSFVDYIMNLYEDGFNVTKVLAENYDLDIIDLGVRGNVTKKSKIIHSPKFDKMLQENFNTLVIEYHVSSGHVKFLEDNMRFRLSCGAVFGRDFNDNFFDHHTYNFNKIKIESR